MNDTLNPMDPAGLYHDQMVVKLALAYKMITNQQYLEAMDIQKQVKPDEPQQLLSDILQSLGFLNSEKFRILGQAKEMLTHKRMEKRFGTLAVNKGYVTEQQLAEALRIQKTEKKEIGEILINLGKMTLDQQQEILEAQKNILVNIPSFDDVCRMAKKKTILERSRPESMTLNVSQDALTAVLVMPENKKDISIKDIQAFLETRGIQFGIIDGETIQKYLQCRDLGLHAFIAAQGQKSTPPVTGPVTVHFENPSLSLGPEKTIPSGVQADSLLADREIFQKGTPLTTVYGIEFEDKDQDDKIFIPGNGAKINETSSQIIAAMDGEPFIHPDGAICVLQSLELDEVTEDSSPIDIDGRIIISGQVGPNSVIHGAHILAARIDGATIRSDGDLWVENDLINSTVVAAGTVRATVITNCRISSIGDVLSETDIKESQINTQGICLVGKRIHQSHIKAVRGLEAQDIFSLPGNPTRIEFGKAFVPEFIADDVHMAEKMEIGLNDMLAQIQSRESMTQITQQIIQEISRDLAKNEQEQDLLTKSVDRMEQKSQRTIASGRNRIMTLAQEITAARDTMETLRADGQHTKDELVSLKKVFQVKLKEYKEMKGRINREITVMKQRLKGHPKIDGIHVRDLAQAGTLIHGPHSEITLGEDQHGVSIMEILVTDENPKGPIAHSLRISPLSAETSS
ncbi:MAG: FapA family protein [Proteobacteria bacterium]|nr:FapA family protein [Pseudomonadota bacterium]